MDIIEKLIKSLQEAKEELAKTTATKPWVGQHASIHHVQSKNGLHEYKVKDLKSGHSWHMSHSKLGVGGSTPEKHQNGPAEKEAISYIEGKHGLVKNINCASGDNQQNMEKAEMEEPHKDDPNHEKKEKKAAKKIKDEAEDILDMHKMEELTCSANGQWSLKKDAVNPALAPKAKKVKMLQQQIDAGTYKPDAGKIAGAMIEHSKKK